MDLKMKSRGPLTLVLVISLFIGGCASRGPQDYSAAVENCGGLALVCLGTMAITDIATRDESSGKKCSQMRGEKKKRCEAQVLDLKNRINKARNQ